MEITYDLTNKPLKNKLNSNIILRPHQNGVVDNILRNGNNGIIKLGCGFGKSLMACEMIRELGKTALIIVPRLSILNQFKQTLKEFYDYETGIIQGKTWDIKDITIASMATLKKRLGSGIEKKFSIVICDEAHTVISDKGISVVQSFNPSYLYGLTATPRRTDQQGEAIFFTFGPILIDRSLPQHPPQVQIVKSNIPIEVSIDYNEMIDNLVIDMDRNRLIAFKIFNEWKKGRKILVLTKRIQHYKNIESTLKGYCWELSGTHTEVGLNLFRTHIISSSTPQKERDELLTKLRNNEEDFDIILGTYSMLAVGVDCPALDTIILAGDAKSDVMCQQAVGRIMRIFKGKKDPKVIDLDDNLNPILHRQALYRRKFYKSMGWNIIT